MDSKSKDEFLCFFSSLINGGKEMTLTEYYNLIKDDAGKILKYERKQFGYSWKKLAKLAYTDPETI